MRNLALCLGFLVVATVFSSCGKVVQQVAKNEPPKSFNLNFTIGPVELEPYLLPDRTHFTWDVSDEEVFVQILGIGASGVSELSWGRAVLLADDVEPEEAQVSSDSSIALLEEDSVTSTVYESVSFRKDGLRLTTGSNHKWSEIKYVDDSNSWSVVSNKIKLGFPYYHMIFYSDQNHFMMKTVDAEFVSGNPQVNLGAFDDYDLFISILVSEILDERPDYYERADMMDVLVKVMPLSFYRELSYRVPVNSVESFSSENPAFNLTGPLEKELVKWFFLLDEDFQAAQDYIDSFESDWFTDELRKSYQVVMDAFDK